MRSTWLVHGWRYKVISRSNAWRRAPPLSLSRCRFPIKSNHTAVPTLLPGTPPQLPLPHGVTSVPSAAKRAHLTPPHSALPARSSAESSGSARPAAEPGTTFDERGAGSNYSTYLATEVGGEEEYVRQETCTPRCLYVLTALFVYNSKHCLYVAPKPAQPIKARSRQWATQRSDQHNIQNSQRQLESLSVI
ncbi:hypothetical protein T492DRAFT_479120 [Pavlovales sp. CCMP2436]|nr:hypothetical protein T492DRAFT_479120 [Pavlovales sp. CCMP2436]